MVTEELLEESILGDVMIGEVMKPPEMLRVELVGKGMVWERVEYLCNLVAW